MRKLFAVIILLFSHLNGYCQTDSSKTEVIIIGTMHYGNKYFNHKTLYQLIDSLNPDIILNESNNQHKQVFGLKTARFLKVFKPTIEQLTLQTFKKRNKSILMLPYDTTFQNPKATKNPLKAEYRARVKYVKKETKTESRVFDSLHIAKKDAADSIKLSTYITKRNIYFRSFKEMKLGEINDPQFYNTAGEICKDDQELILPLIKKYVKDTTLYKEFESNLSFWNERNNFMVSQIENIAKSNPKKRIIVLTGLYHKYFLVNKLSNQNRNNIRLTALGKEI